MRKEDISDTGDEGEVDADDKDDERGQEQSSQRAPDSMLEEERIPISSESEEGRKTTACRSTKSLKEDEDSEDEEDEARNVEVEEGWGLLSSPPSLVILYSTDKMIPST